MVDKSVNERAIRLLARREHSKKELIQKLLNKVPVPESTISKVVNQIAAQGYQSDDRFVEMYVRSQSHKFYGPIKTINELSFVHGISETLIDQYVNHGAVDWLQIALAALNKKYRMNANLDLDVKSKAFRYLTGRGFPVDIINQAWNLWIEAHSFN